MSYSFKGHDWTELAECWGLTVKKQEFAIGDEGDEAHLELIGETADITFHINDTKITVTTNDEEEVLAEKVKRYISDNIDFSTGEFIDKQMRQDLHNFLTALYKESKKTDYNYPVYEGLLKIENDYTLAKWVTHSLERFWT